MGQEAARPEQIEAAAKAAWSWDSVNEAACPWEDQDDGVKSWYREIVSVALEAAGVVPLPPEPDDEQIPRQGYDYPTTAEVLRGGHRKGEGFAT